MTEGIWLAFCLWALVCGAGVLVCLYGEFHQKISLAVSGKLVAASAYLAAAFSLGAPYSRYGRLVLAGMFFCWLGDLLLVSKRSRWLFMTGLAVFLLGHLAYSTAFLTRGVNEGALAAGLVMMLIFGLAVAQWLRPHLDARMKALVYLYIAVISVMMTCALGTFAIHRSLVMLFGAALFVISDLAVARNRFISAGFINRAWGLPVYFAAQLLLAASVII